MINLNYRKLATTIVGTVDGKPFNIPNTEDNLVQLGLFQEDADTKRKDVLLWARSVRNQEIAGSNPFLLHNPVTGEYFLQHDNFRSKHAIPKSLVKFIEESFDKEIDFMPIIKTWARFLANPRYTKAKGKLFANYLDAKYVDEKEASEIMEELKCTKEAAVAMATYQDIAITQEGLLATYKVADMVTWEYIMEWDDDAGENGEYVKIRNRKYTPIAAKLDPTTGEVLEPATFEKPDFLEDYQFTPAICKSGDKFFSGPKLGYVYKVGEVQRLPKDAKRNLNNTFGGGGLYIGGLKYIDGYSNDRTHTLCCFVNPGDIISFQDDGMAFRTDALMPNNVWDEDVPLKGIYHSSDYDKLSGDRLDAIMKDAVHRDVDLAVEQDKINMERELGRKMEEENAAKESQQTAPENE